MKITYFPYLPNSKNEDNKRYKFFIDKIEKEPFTYHKKKNSSFFFNKHYYVSNNTDFDFNKNQNKVNQELLFFQNEHDKYINSYNDFMKKKSYLIEENAEKYLNYITNSKNQNKNNNLSQNNINNYLQNRNHNILPPLTNKNLSKSKSELNINLLSSRYPIKSENEKNNFIPSIIKVRGTDITNPFYYDHVTQEIMNKNLETMDYNIKMSENKLKKKKIMSKYDDNKIALAPNKINNPKYYDLGESLLDKNPILNKGNYSPSFSLNANYFNRHKNVFGK